MAQKPAEHQVGYKHAGEDGTFKRQISSFRSWISSEPGAKFPPEKDRYVRIKSLVEIHENIY
jgi:putative glutathione S-transferase